MYITMHERDTLQQFDHSFDELINRPSSSRFIDGGPQDDNERGYRHSPDALKGLRSTYSHTERSLDTLLTSNTESVSSARDYSLDTCTSAATRDALSFDHSPNMSDDEDVSYDTECTDCETEHRLMVLESSTCYSLIAEKNAKAMKREVDRLLNFSAGDEGTADNDTSRAMTAPLDIDSIVSIDANSNSCLSPLYPASLCSFPTSQICDRQENNDLPGSYTSYFIRRQQSRSLRAKSRTDRQLGRGTGSMTKTARSKLAMRPHRENIVKRTRVSSVGDSNPSSPSNQLVKQWSSLTGFVLAYCFVVTILASLFYFAFLSIKFKDNGPTITSYTIYIEAANLPWLPIQNETCSTNVIVRIHPDSKD